MTSFSNMFNYLVLVLVLVVVEPYESLDSSSTSVFFFTFNKLPV